MGVFRDNPCLYSSKNAQLQNNTANLGPDKKKPAEKLLVLKWQNLDAQFKTFSA